MQDSPARRYWWVNQNRTYRHEIGGGYIVEPGRTREGHVLFDAPAGAKVKITLKEDRENGRVMDLAVRYPF